MPPSLSRRKLLAAAAALAGTSWVPHAWTSAAANQTEAKSPNDRWRIGSIGMRYQGTVIAREALAFGDVVAICDVDKNVREQARAAFGSTPAIFEDYRELLARDDIDVIT